jgi:hypothetical protein
MASIVLEAAMTTIRASGACLAGRAAFRFVRETAMTAPLRSGVNSAL